jgi:hypothetical protein
MSQDPAVALLAARVNGLEARLASLQSQTLAQRMPLVPGVVDADNGDGTFNVKIYPYGYVYEYDTHGTPTTGDPTLADSGTRKATRQDPNIGYAKGDKVVLLWIDKPEYLILAGGGGGMVPAKIMSGGPGDTYVVDLYGKGPAQAATKTGVTVKQLYINPAATIPPDTWVFVTRLGKDYWMQVPIWL